LSTYRDITIRLNDQEFRIGGLVGFELVKTVNDHAWLTVRGKVAEESKTHFAELALDEVKVEFGIKRAILFQGLVTDFDLYYADGQDRFLLQAASYTYEMDRNVRARSFQNTKMLIADLVNQVMSAYPNGECVIDQALADQVLGKFTLQFRETDFAFLRRMASRCYTGLVPDATVAYPRLSLGFRAGEDRGVLRERECQVMISRNISEYKEFIGNAPRGQAASVWAEDFTRYRLFTPELFDLGDKLTVGNSKLTVCEARAYLDKGIIRYTCVAASEGGFKVRPLFNSQIIGMSLGGTVLAVGAATEQKDMVKVGLAIDGEQKVEEATWFPCLTPYAAEGNTGWYVMPEVGDEVRLTFPTEFEEEAVVTCAIRHKGTDAVNKPNQKYFRTKYGKRMIFEPERFLFVGKNDRLGMTLGGKNDVKFNSPEAKFAIKAVGNINFHAENVVNLSTGNAITCALGSGENKRVKLKMDVGKTKGEVAFLGKVWEEDGGKVAPAAKPEVKKSEKSASTAPKSDKKDKNKHCHRHDEFLKELEQFPEDYRPALIQLHNKHIEWRFVAYHTGVDFNSFVDAQMEKGVTTTNEDRFIKHPKTKGRDSGYFVPTREGVIYYMDPRNLLTEKLIFQFLSGEYNLELQKIEIVEDILKESALAGKGQSFLEAAGTNANAAFLAAMAMVESGGGTSKLAIGNVQNYKGWYNLYGIGAYDGPTAATNAAKFAKDHGWNTVEKAIVGGGKFIVEKYIKTGRGSVNNFVLLT